MNYVVLLCFLATVTHVCCYGNRHGSQSCPLDQCANTFHQQVENLPCTTAENNLNECIETNTRDTSEICDCDLTTIVGLQFVRNPSVNLCNIKRCLTESAFTPCLQLMLANNNGQGDNEQLDEILQCLYNSRAQGEDLHCISNIFNSRGSLVLDFIYIIEDARAGCPIENLGDCGALGELLSNVQSPDIAEACEDIDVSRLRSCVDRLLPAQHCQNARQVFNGQLSFLESFVRDMCEATERLGKDYQASCAARKNVRDIFARREVAKKSSWKDMVKIFL